jgi:alpha-glucosidase
VQVESSQPDSLLKWYQQLIALRVNNPALHDGQNIMVNTSDPNVLSYLRKNPSSGPSVLVAMNFTSRPRIVSYHLEAQGIQAKRAVALLEDQGMNKDVDLGHVVLPAFAVFVGELR